MLTKFRTYQLAVELYRNCTQIQAPSHLKDQLLRASLSIVLNLSEGSARPTAKDRRRFYSIAFASLRETQSCLDLIQTPEAVTQLADQIGGCLFKLSRNT